MATTPSCHGVRAPYIALKRASGSDHPISFSISEKKAIDVDATGELENSNCWATPQGWVLVRDAAASSTYLLDPHDHSTKIQLPHLPEDDLPSVCTCLLSGYPDPADSGRSLVLLIEPDNPIIRYCHIGADEWVKFEYDIGILDLPDDDCFGWSSAGCSEKLVICSIAACNGKFYFNGGFDELGVLEFSPAPAFSSVAIRDAVEFGCQKEFLVESRQELFMVSLLSVSDLNVVYRVQVHRMDFSKQEWREVDDIGGRVFLLSPWYFGASRSAAECGLEANCVYMAYPRKKRLMVFNVKDGTTKMQELDGAPVSEQALWMLPISP